LKQGVQAQRLLATRFAYDPTEPLKQTEGADRPRFTRARSKQRVLPNLARTWRKLGRQGASRIANIVRVVSQSQRVFQLI
jgi:hypothetical protein